MCANESEISEHNIIFIQSAFYTQRAPKTTTEDAICSLFAIRGCNRDFSLLHLLIVAFIYHKSLANLTESINFRL